jgi:long-chain acyl-CoA synthetase
VNPLHAFTVGDLLREHRRNLPGRLALAGEGLRLSFPELDLRVNRLASALRERGLRPGARLAWLAQNDARYLEALLAAAKLGASFCPLNWRGSPEELAFALSDAEPALVLWQEREIGESARAARARAAHGVPWVPIDAGGDGSYEALLAGAAADDPGIEVDPEAPLLHMYTAGFGGQPSGALLSHRAILAQSLVLAHVCQVSCEDVYLSAGPLFHMGNFMFLMAYFLYGAANVLVRRNDAEAICRAIESERCTAAYLVGPQLQQIADANRDGRFDLSSLRASRGSPGWAKMVGAGESPWLRDPGGYGQTEAMGMVTLNALGGPHQGSHGRPSPLLQVRILDEQDRELPPGEVGEIAVRGPTVMNGYHARPELNAERQRGGWHHTRDLGRREPDGSITFIGPKLRMLKSAAENIYPAEVERCIASHPAVAECAVIGVPDPTWVQSVKAIVRLAPGRSASEAEIIEHCRARIASYKKPRSVEFVDAIPRRGFAVDYDALDARFGGGGYPGGTTRSA